MPPSRPPRQGWLAYYGGFLEACVRRIGNRADAEDIAHDAVEQLLRADASGALQARQYLFQAAQHRTIDAWRRQERLPHVAWDCLPEDTHPIAAPADATLATGQLAEALAHALQELPPKCREAFVLNRIEGWSQREIAQRMGLSTNMVERHVMRAMQHVRQRLDGYDTR
ncbi:ECF family sigma factor [Bordetella ansorpii]|uniref:ECF family sigma factor n=1 Tax=Bordetella ansorpii TaxID=288768 RepID=A0A157NWM6_9BORD|nr:RNA polymerase sigma factor [Bordetella ansorpii]SAI25685.1 ECF family sigma factor [Bordetella ansorpii]